MFIFNVPETQTLEIKVKTPASAQTKPSRSEHSFNLKVKYLSHTDKNELREAMPTYGKDVDDILSKKLIVGWEQIKDQDNKPVEFSDENLAMLMEVPWVRNGILLKIYEYLFSTRVAEEIEKNL